MSINRIKTIAAFIFVLVALQAKAATAAVLVIDSGGQLLGADGVDVGGTFYDVRFVVGTCIDLFDGCDEQSDFVFSTAPEAELAAQALLDQVFVGVFDTDPLATAPCVPPALICYTWVPFGEPFQASGIDVVSIAIALNHFDETSDGFDGISAHPVDDDLSPLYGFVYADFATSEIPVPGALPLMASALAGGFFIRRRSRQRTNASLKP